MSHALGGIPFKADLVGLFSNPSAVNVVIRQKNTMRILLAFMIF